MDLSSPLEIDVKDFLHLEMKGFVISQSPLREILRKILDV
jgi:hypothetical protein